MEAVFAQVARSQPPSVLAQVVRAWADQVDPIATVTAEDEVHRRRLVHLSQVGDCWHLDGMFGHEQGATLAAALNAAITLARRRCGPADTSAANESCQVGTDDCETTTCDESTAFVGFGPDPVALINSRQRADALIDLARLALASGGLPETGGAKPTVVITVPLGRLEQTESTSALPGFGQCAGSDGPLPFIGGSAQLTVSDGIGQDLISETTAQRMACDAEVQRIGAKRRWPATRHRTDFPHHPAAFAPRAKHSRRRLRVPRLRPAARLG